MAGRWRIVLGDRFLLPWLVLISLGAAAWYFFSATATTPAGLPFDDAWIHLTLARNLADTGAMGLQAGRWSGGSSSLLWTLLLALLYRLSGLSLEGSLALGALLQALSAVFFYALARDFLESPLAVLAGLLYALCGPLVFLGLSGMETALFLFLGLAALWCWSHGRTVACSLLLVLLVLTRIEGLVLWGLLLLHGLLAGRPGRSLAGLLGLAILPPAAFLLTGLLRLRMEGQFLPLTLAGRRWLWGIDPGPLPLWPAPWTAIVQYLRIWATYLLDWLWQSFRLESLPALMGAYRALGLFVLLGGACYVGCVSWKKRKEVRRLGAAGLLLWGLAHWALYLIFAPIATLRHQVVVLPGLVLLGSAALAGMGFLLRRAPALSRRIVVALALGGLVLGSGLVFEQWRRNYADHVRHINQLHVLLGRWSAANLPEDAVVAAFDIGALSYLGGREVVDLGGLTDPAFLPAVYARQVIPYLQAHGVTHLAMVGSPGEYAWRQLGLIPPAWGEEFRLQALWESAIPAYAYPPFDRPADYYYYPASLRIAVYQVEWLKPFPGGVSPDHGE